MSRQFCLTHDLKSGPTPIAEYGKYQNKVWPDLGTIRVLETVSNVVWGDKDIKTLYITAQHQCVPHQDESSGSETLRLTNLGPEAIGVCSGLKKGSSRTKLF